MIEVKRLLGELDVLVDVGVELIVHLRFAGQPSMETSTSTLILKFFY